MTIKPITQSTLRSTLFLFLCLSLSNSSLVAEEESPIPINIKKHMQSMIGVWTFQGKDGERKFSGKETIKVVNNATALLQEGYFDLGKGKKEHYVILSGWDGDKKTVIVRGFTSEGFTFSGEWKKLEYRTWVGTASGSPAKFEVKDDSMRYTESSKDHKWVSEFTRIADE